MNEIEFGALVGLIVGIGVGLVPLFKGLKKNQPGLAIGGFICSAIAGAILGLFLAVPVAAGFWWVIATRPNKSDEYKP